MLVTVVISLCGCVGHDDLHTGVGSVVSSLPLLPIAVSHVVRILLVKLHRSITNVSCNPEIKVGQPPSFLQVCY